MLIELQEHAEVILKILDNINKLYEEILSRIVEAFKNFLEFLNSEEGQTFVKTILDGRKTHYFRYMAWIELKKVRA